MPKNKIVDVGGTRYTVRGLTFEELVKLGSASTEEKESKAVVAEVLSRCLIEPHLKNEDIRKLDEKTLVALVSEVLDLAKGSLEGMGFVAMPPDKGPPRDMIA
jgi:hypothetical protein